MATWKKTAECLAQDDDIEIAYLNRLLSGDLRSNTLLEILIQHVAYHQPQLLEDALRQMYEEGLWPPQEAKLEAKEARREASRQRAFEAFFLQGGLPSLGRRR